MSDKKILALNPGSTSTKGALFEGDRMLADLEISHPADELAAFDRVYDQLDFRETTIAQEFERQGVELGALDAVVGRGGFLHPLAGGAYRVGEAMLADLRCARYGEHPCNLGAELAQRFAARAGSVPAFIVDPVVTDELMDAARTTGHPDIERRSAFHALNQRGAARAAATELDLAYEEANLVVAHLGGGISVGAHCKGRVVDVTNALDGEGPMTAERTGALPLLPLLDLLESGETDFDELRRTIKRGGGLLAHLGTTDLREAEARAADGDWRAQDALDAMAYGIARAIASMLPAFIMAGDGDEVDGIVLTGGMARSQRLTSMLTALVGRHAPVLVITGMEEMLAMASGALLVLRGQTEAAEYLSKD